MAVLEELLGEAMARYEPMAQRPLADRIMFAVEELSAMRNLVDTVHSRRTTSPVIDQWHTGFHATADALTRADCRPTMRSPRATSSRSWSKVYSHIPTTKPNNRKSSTYSSNASPNGDPLVQPTTRTPEAATPHGG